MLRLINTAKRLLTVYYGCKGLEHPRRATHLTVSSSYVFPAELIINAKSFHTSASHPIYNLELQFFGARNALARKIIPLFPLKHVREYTIEWLDVFTDDCLSLFRRMKGLLHLRLDSMDVEPVLYALDLIDEGVHREVT